jgi:4-alpha-glucanotransferase
LTTRPSSAHPRTAGILLPAFTPRRPGDLGIGDTLALHEWIDWAAEHHIAFLQILPINEHGADDSPYSAISTAALDPIFLAFDPGQIPDLTDRDLARARATLGDLVHATEVDYPAVRRTKRNLLETAWTRFQDAGTKHPLLPEFDAFRKAEAHWLDDYCLFRHLCDLHGEEIPWDQWPPRLRTPQGARRFVADCRKQDAAAIDYRLGYFAFVQWLCHRQWRALREHADARGVKLMGDIPIGIARHSADVFFHREQFHLDWCGGSPGEGPGHPDPFTARWGQNWGIPLYRWDSMEADGYQWWKHRIARTTGIFHWFRIDHILGFYRIYAFPWQPSDNERFAHLDAGAVANLTDGLLPRWWQRPDDTFENQEANLADGQARLRGILNGIPAEHVIAEDLGWVPPYVRPHLQNLGICGYRIPHWDCDSGGHPLPPSAFPEASFACFSTHDHDPLCAIWRGCLAATRSHPPGSPDAWMADGARNTLRILSEFAHIPMPHDGHTWHDYTEGIHLRLMKALLDSKARHVLIAVTECFSINGRINSPGTHGRQNWSFRLPWTLDEIRRTPALADAGHKLANLIHLARRTPNP